MHNEHKIIDKKVLVALCLVILTGIGVAVLSFPSGSDSTLVREPDVVVNPAYNDSKHEDLNGTNTDPEDTIETSEDSHNQDTNGTSASTQEIEVPVQNGNDPSLTTSGASSGFDATRVISITNAYRAQRGLNPLRYSATLAASANRKVDLIFQEQHFEHTSLSGKEASDLIQEAGYQFLAIGENLALGTYGSEQSIVDWWIDSPPHHQVLISPYFEEIAVGLRQGVFRGQKVWVVVQHFGRSVEVCTAVAPEQSVKQRIDTQSAQLRAWEQEIQEKQVVLRKYAPSYGVEYNQVAREYDALVQQYNALLQEAQQEIEAYTRQIKAYNDCVNIEV